MGTGVPTAVAGRYCPVRRNRPFSVITLPVEFDASNRALKWLDSAGITYKQEHDMAKDALKWAAMTYVVAAVSSVVILIRYIMIYLGASRRD